MSIDIYGAKSCYNSNPNLKKAGISVKMTEYEVEEYARCHDDITYFLEKYCKIVSLDEGVVNFKPFPYQKKAIKIMDSNRFSIFLMARQMGKTTVVAAYLLHAAIFNKDFNIAILANKQDQAIEVLDRIQKMYEDLPWFLQPGVHTWNKKSIKLGNGTKVFTRATSKGAARGQSLNIVYLDEFAFVENDTEFYTSTYPVITSGKKTKVIITSTPNGMNLFYKLYTEAVQKKNSYAHYRVDWHHHPMRDEKWKKEQLKNMTERQFLQEFCNEFFGSSDTLISGSKLESLAAKEPISEKGGLKVFEMPKENHSYVASVDVSEGIGKDFSVVNVFDITEMPYRQVAVYRANDVTPNDFAQKVNTIGKKYNDAFLVVESNSVGSTVCSNLWNDFEYENLLRSSMKNSQNIIDNSNTSEIGLRMTKKTKSIGCSNLKELIENDIIQLADEETIKELSTFTKQNGSYKAEKGKFDDLAMTLVSFAWFSNQTYFQSLTDLDTRKHLMEKINEENEPFGFFLQDGTEDESVWG